MKLLVALVCSVLFEASSNAQLVRSTKSLNDAWEGASLFMGPGSNELVTELSGNQRVHVGSLLGGQTVADLTSVSSLTTFPAMYGGPYYREEYITGGNPYIHGPPVIDWTDPLSLVFDNPVEAVGIDIVHRFGPSVETFPPGEVEILAFDSSAKFIGMIYSTATSGAYTDPSSWEFISFETADRSSSIKAITIYNANNQVAIAPAVRFLTGAPVPETSTYGLCGAALLVLVLARRSRFRWRELDTRGARIDDSH